QYEDGKEMLIFDLKRIDKMVERVSELLKVPADLRKIAENGFERASSEDTWEERAKLFLSYLKECPV
ncbi:MAG: glycosyltransferase family 1 protein, partial [Lachnospiraceae bacterium]|nr:glycosyltransferase family 1 protein [Lachnospiraceae bacterium]